MDRDTLRVAVVALLAVLALSAAAATLDTATSTGGGMGPSDSGGQGFDDDEGDSVLPSEENDGGTLFGGNGMAPTTCYDQLRDPRIIAAVVLVVVAALLVIRHRYDTIVSAAFLMAFGIPGGIIYMLLAACPTPSNEDGGILPDGGDLPEGGGMLGDEVGRTVPSAPSLLMLALLAGAFLLAAFVIVRGTDDDEEELPEAEVPEPDDRAAAVAAVAGEAADRIEADGDLENEIYRAWREMVGLLDVSNPRATTPGEFADAAADAGIERGDVDELTELFEAVRYGGFEATEDRERRAVSALRRIEDEYEERSG
ncbi:DUF4129 domain-containing protein [Halobacteriales archaeon QS_1_68_20]|nr:MAG: DUF4129 domain-containing protein [Halobacteriales archaeon QS_1_68_20]